MPLSPCRLGALLACLLLPIGALAAQSEGTGTTGSEKKLWPEKKLWITLGGGASFSKFTGADADTATRGWATP